MKLQVSMRHFKFFLPVNYRMVATFTHLHVLSQSTKNTVNSKVQSTAYSKVYLTMLTPYVVLVYTLCNFS